MKAVFMEARPGYTTYTDFQFAKVDRKLNKQLHLPQSCKELFAGTYKPAEFKEKRFRFLVLLSHNDFLKLDAAKTQDFLNQAESELGFSKSRVWDVTKNAPQGTQALLIDSSSRWGHSSPLLHLLLLLARNGSGHDPKKDWKQTLAKFRRTNSFKRADRAQFLIINDILPHILKKKGKMENIYILTNARRNLSTLSEGARWQNSIGICQWASAFKEANKKLVEAI